MLTAAIWIGAFAAFAMFDLDERWTKGQRTFLFCLFWSSPILATIAVN